MDESKRTIASASMEGVESTCELGLSVRNLVELEQRQTFTNFALQKLPASVWLQLLHAFGIVLGSQWQINFI